MPSFIDLSGMKFGRLTVLERDNRHFGRGDHTYWVCKCECGKISGEKYETIAEASERLGISSSCICNQTKKYGYNISFEERGKCHKWTIGR